MPPPNVQPRYFYPRPPGGGRQQIADALAAAEDFYPRPPGGGRRSTLSKASITLYYFYPRPPGGGRLRADSQTVEQLSISIHALRVEGDKFTVYAEFISHISIHALRVEGDVRNV